ncbi:MAG TPA: hypothetical protein VFH97_06055, partial [Gemmatimonadales bacterium]|nr:hypothetical protein [Gemmatimonadales bacterium]
MTPGRLAHVGLAVALAAAGPRVARGQDPVRDTLRPPPPDSARAEIPDSLRPPALLELLPMETPPGPLPPGTRLVFTRDSLLWLSGFTLADVLAEVPGVFVARTGFVGQPAPAFYGGRGMGAVEIFRDGVP